MQKGLQPRRGGLFPFPIDDQRDCVAAAMFEDHAVGAEKTGQNAGPQALESLRHRVGQETTAACEQRFLPIEIPHFLPGGADLAHQALVLVEQGA